MKQASLIKWMSTSTSSSGTDSVSGVDLASVASPGEQLPPGWEWVDGILEDAHFPAEWTRPVEWRTTEGKHAQILIDSETGREINRTTGELKKTTPKIGFIMSTKLQESDDKGRRMPGTDTPASGRLDRYYHPSLQEAIIEDNANEKLVPCFAHGDFVQVKSLQLDHLQAKENIRERQNELVKKLNNEPDFAKLILAKPGMNKFFKRAKNGIAGTLLFYEIYLNDIDNLWLICSACNLQKSDQDTLEWLSNQWMYGRKFLDYIATLGIEQGKGILDKTSDKRGLAEVAISWFWEQHATYVSTAKDLYANVVTPIQILNRRVDYVAGSGNLEESRRLQVGLSLQLEIMKMVVNARVGPPRHSSEAKYPDGDPFLSPMYHSDGEEVKFEVEDCEAANKSVMAKLPGVLQFMSREAYEHEASRKRVRKKS